MFILYVDFITEWPPKVINNVIIKKNFWGKNDHLGALLYCTCYCLELYTGANKNFQSPKPRYALNQCLTVRLQWRIDHGSECISLRGKYIKLSFLHKIQRGCALKFFVIVMFINLFTQKVIYIWFYDIGCCMILSSNLSLRKVFITVLNSINITW